MTAPDRAEVRTIHRPEAAPAPFDASTACQPAGPCRESKPCALRCYARWVDGQEQSNDAIADAVVAAARALRGATE